MFNLKWKDLIFYEITLIAFGILIGAKWSDFFWEYRNILIVIFIVFGVHIFYTLYTQLKNKN